ncbi:MAG: choice-of-anchor J domain-containing protein [Flavobacteriaceae bacterium]
MKKLIYLVAIVAVFFTGCNPMDDINAEIDAQDNPLVASTEYTLTSDDYDTLELNYGSFSSIDDAKEALPDFIKDMYPHWGNGSSILIGYNLYIGSAEGINDFTGADVYQFTNADYASTGSDAFGFYPDVNADDHIADVLDAQITSPTEGQVVLAKFKKYTETPVIGLADIVSYDFVGSMAGWTTTDVIGAEGWTSEAAYLQISGYNSGQQQNEDWLISPSIDLTGESNLKFQINQYMKYLNGHYELLNIVVSTDYTNDVAAATWNPVTVTTLPTGSGDWVMSEDVDFSAYDGQTINIAFKYESTTSDAPRWRIDGMSIKTLGVTGDTANYGTHYVYTGGDWEKADEAYYLSSVDFDSMGEGYQQPGQYDNFGSSVRPENYLPAFLNISYPFAQDEDELFVIYPYYSSSSGAQTRGNLYTFTDGAWIGHESTIATTLQFGHDGSTWVPDNTIRYTLDRGADYDYMAAQLAGNADYDGLLGNLETYDDFDYNWSDAQIVFALDLFLNHHDPTAEEGQKYILTYVVYDGGESDHTKNFIKTAGEWVVNN